MYHYHCNKCQKEEDYGLDPFQLKMALNPTLACKETWDEEDWKAPIGFCECGGEIVVGFSKKDSFINICTSGDPQGFWSMELGALGEQQAEIKAKNSQAVFNNFGARWVESPTHLKKVLKERGMVELTESSEYRDFSDKQLEKVRNKHEAN